MEVLLSLFRVYGPCISSLRAHRYSIYRQIYKNLPANEDCYDKYLRQGSSNGRRRSYSSIRYLTILYFIKVSLPLFSSWRSLHFESRVPLFRVIGSPRYSHLTHYYCFNLTLET